MRQGYRVIDADTHVTPSVEVLVDYGDRELKDRADELTPYVRVDQADRGPGPSHPSLRRGGGSTPSPTTGWPATSPTPPSTLEARGPRGRSRGRVQNLAVKPIADGIQHTNSEGRLANMDVEGVDINFIIPAPGRREAPRWTSAWPRPCTAPTTATWPTTARPIPAA